jgi:hypothetical protein
MSITEETPSAPLPAWDELTDLDKGAALLHLWKREREGAEYAVENYPAGYFDHPALTALDRAAASAHAASLEDDAEALNPAEWTRLYDLALAADDARPAARRP